jgi:hypothetical protein
LVRWANSDSGIERSTEVEKIADVKGFAGVDGVVLGVDTHLDVHVAVALDHLGRRLGELTVPTTTREATRDSFVGRRALALWSVSE